MEIWELFLIVGVAFTVAAITGVVIFICTRHHKFNVHKVKENGLPITVHEDDDQDSHTHHWDYRGVMGPKHWHMIDGVVVGTHQSPVNFSDDHLLFSRDEFMPDIHYRTHLPDADHPEGGAEIHHVDSDHMEKALFHGPVQPLNANNCEPIAHHGGHNQSHIRGVPSKDNSPKVADTGHSIQINLPASNDEYMAAVGGYVNFLGQKYHLRQIHFHSPSEHIIKGMSHRMEAHFVHANDNGGLLVIGMFIVKAEVHEQTVTFLDSILHEIPKSTKEAPHKLNGFDLDQAERLIRGCPSYYLYDGSLTTPPCTEGVHWIVCNMTFPMKRRLIEAIEKRMPAGNARPAFSSKSYKRVHLVPSESQLQVGDVEVDDLDLPRTVEIHEGHDDKGHVDGHTDEWTYDGPKGPEHWHTIDGDVFISC
ncbi:hypothetical protein HDU79_001835 [Rhizoclosmatium sp. JEL0117]|nr:hypothetical protein HDU79_001835 [Rhizoclosmatium sp. JEL0117]